MKWFERLPIHRKLVAIALAVTTVALVLATAGLMALDLWNYRRVAQSDTTALAHVVAQTTAAAVMFDESTDAETLLAAVRARENVTRACLYLPDGSRFAGFSRDPESACEAEATVRPGWTRVTGEADVRWNDTFLGRVYIERELAEIHARSAAAVGTSLAMFIVAGTLALIMAHRLHRTISKPIVQLAEAARSLDAQGHQPTLAPIQAGADEVGDLVRAFGGMLQRIGDTTASLRRREAEREALLEREREASRLKDEFLATVSHELRTPLNAIVGWTEILTTTRVDERTQRRGLESVARNARAQARVIEDLVDVSRIVTGKLRLRFSPVDLREPVDGAVDAVRPTAEAKGIRLEVEHTPGVEVRGDRDRLQQIVWNLLSNAVKFTPPGGSVTVHTCASNGSREVSVSDTGVGIAPEFLAFVFDRFRQADGSTTRTHSGLGLGLALVKELTELHGGSVEVESAGHDRGSRFVVRLPALDSRGDTAAVSRETHPHPPRTLAGVSVLVVDDNPDALEVLSTTLTGAGADVRTASSGTEAIVAWRRSPAEVLLCDIAMPDIDGREVLRQIRESDAKAGRFTPAVALSAHAGRDQVTRSLDAGFAVHLTKPYGATELVETLTAVLTGRIGEHRPFSGG